MSAILTFDKSLGKYVFTINHVHFVDDQLENPNEQIINFKNNMLTSYVLAINPFVNNMGLRTARIDFTTVIDSEVIPVMSLVHVSGNLTSLSINEKILSIENIYNMDESDPNYSNIFKTYYAKTVISYLTNNVQAELHLNLCKILKNIAPEESSQLEPFEQTQEEPSEPVQEEPSEPVQEEPSEPEQEEPSEPVQEEPSEPVQEEPSESEQDESSDSNCNVGNLSEVQMYNKKYHVMQGRRYVINPLSPFGIMGSVLTWNNIQNDGIVGSVYPASTNKAVMSIPMNAFDGYDLNTNDMYTDSRYAMNTAVKIALPMINVDISNTIFGPGGNSELAPLDCDGKFAGPNYPQVFEVNSNTYELLNDDFKKWCLINDNVNDERIELCVDEQNLYGKIALTYRVLDENNNVSIKSSCNIYVLPYSNLLVDNVEIKHVEQYSSNNYVLSLRNAHILDDRNMFNDEDENTLIRINNATYCRILPPKLAEISNYKFNEEHSEPFLEGFEYTSEVNVMHWANEPVEIPYSFNAGDNGRYEAQISMNSIVFSRYSAFSDSRVVVTCPFIAIAGNNEFDNVVVGNEATNVGKMTIYGENSDVALHVHGVMLIDGHNILDLVNNMRSNASAKSPNNDKM